MGEVVMSKLIVNYDTRGRAFLDPRSMGNQIQTFVTQAIRNASGDPTQRDLLRHLRPAVLWKLLTLIGYAESRFRIYAKNPTSTAAGVWQLVASSRAGSDLAAYTYTSPDLHRDALHAETQLSDALKLAVRWLRRLASPSGKRILTWADQLLRRDPAARNVVDVLTSDISHPTLKRLNALVVLYLIRCWASGFHDNSQISEAYVDRLSSYLSGRRT